MQDISRRQGFSRSGILPGPSRPALESGSGAIGGWFIPSLASGRTAPGEPGQESHWLKMVSPRPVTMEARSW
jgi:hypothetical protein